jgi:hypothetical protein
MIRIRLSTSAFGGGCGFARGSGFARSIGQFYAHIIHTPVDPLSKSLRSRAVGECTGRLLDLQQHFLLRATLAVTANEPRRKFSGIRISAVLFFVLLRLYYCRPCNKL